MRDSIQKNFSLEHMVQTELAVYRELIHTEKEVNRKLQ